MQNFWWNRKFYHGKEEPDSFRLHRLEEEQAAGTSAIEALTQAQTALDALAESQGTLLSEHTSLLSDLTLICEGLEDEVQAISTECSSIGSELAMLETADEALSVRVDAVEETCADTAAEQATKIAAAETAIVAQEARITAAEAGIATQDERITAAETALVAPPSGFGAIQFYGVSGTIPITMGGLKYGSPMTHYAEDGTATAMFLSESGEKALTLPKGGNWLCGKAEGLTIKGGVLNYCDLTGMPSLKKLSINGATIGTMDISKTPHLTELKLGPVYPLSSATLDFSGQTELGSLTMNDYIYVDVILPEQPQNLFTVTIGENLVGDEAFFERILPDRTGRTGGMIGSPAEISFPVLAERNWKVVVIS